MITVGPQPISVQNLVLLMDSFNPRCVIGYNPSTFVPSLTDMMNLGSTTISVTNVHYQPNPRELYYDGTNQLSFSLTASYNDVFASPGGTAIVFTRALSSGPANDGRIIGKSSNGAEFSAGWWLNSAGAPGNPCSLKFMRATNGNHGLWQTSGSPLTLSKNHMLVISYNDSTPSVAPNIWVDGKLQTLTVVNALTGIPTTDSSSNFQVGNGLSLARGYDGFIDCIMIYKRVLSSSDLLYILHNNIDRYKITVKGQF